MKKWLLALLLTFGLSTPAMATAFSSNCANLDTRVACDWENTAAWTPTGTPGLADTWTVAAEDAYTIANSINIGQGTLNGFLSFEETLSNADADGFVTATVTTSAANTGLTIGAAGILRLRARNRLAFDTAGNVAWYGSINVVAGGKLEIVGGEHDTTIQAFTDAAAAANPCGTTTGRLWVITPESGISTASAKQRIVFKSGKAAPRHLEIIATSIATHCTAASIPFPCCTALNVGATCDGSKFAVCTNLLNGTSCAAGATPADDQNSCGQQLTPHATVGTFPISRHPVPTYDSTDPKVQILAAVGDEITIIDDAWVFQSAGTAGFVIRDSSFGTAGPQMPQIRAANLQGLGRENVGGIAFAGVNIPGTDFWYNNIHDYQEGPTFRGFQRFSVRWNACHDAATLSTDNAGCINLLPSRVENGFPFDSPIEDVLYADNTAYRTRGNALQLNGNTTEEFASRIRVTRNLVYQGCTASAEECNGIEVDACVGCSVTNNVVYDVCDLTAVGGDGINLGSSATVTQPAGQGIENIMAGSYASDNWLVNLCGNGIDTHYGETAQNPTQKVATTRNYIAHVRLHGVRGGRAYGNVIFNYGMENAGASAGLTNPIIAKSNFIFGVDSVVKALTCNCAQNGIITFDGAGNTNLVKAVLEDNIIVGMGAASGQFGIRLNAGLFAVDADHNILDGIGRSHTGIQTFQAGAFTMNMRDWVVTHTNAGVSIRGSADIDSIDVCGPWITSQAPATTDDVNISADCATGSSADVLNTEYFGPGNVGFKNRLGLDYNYFADEPALTNGIAPAGSALGVRAFRFDRTKLSDTWSGLLPWHDPFPANVSNGVSNVDTDGDGVIDLHDNCDIHWNPGQTDTSDNGVGDACS